MPRARVQRIQDAVHGLMEFRGMETVVVDVLRTPEVQRLRRVRQLGLAHLVFPGAEHSRFVHSLGVAYLAIQFSRRVREAGMDRLPALLLPGDAAIRDLATAALCHDLGHGALSHAWEREVIGDAFDRAAWAAALGLEPNTPGLLGMKWHELVAQGLLAWEDGHLHQLLETHEDGFSARVRGILRGEHFVPYLPMLLNGDVDVDRADFLKRDTQQCGVRYGDYDLDWLVSTCTVGTDRDGRLVAGFEQRKALRVVEHFLTARRALYENVYYHKTVRSAERLVAKFLRRLKEVIRDYTDSRVEGLVGPLVKMLSGQTVGPRELLSFDDYAVSVLIDSVARADGLDPTARDLGRRIIDRDLFKMVPVDSRRVRDFLLEPDSRDRMLAIVRKYAPGEPQYYLVEDRYEFSMLSRKPDASSYFVDDQGQATLLQEHEGLRLYWGSTEELFRLYTITEAVPELTILIQP